MAEPAQRQVVDVHCHFDSATVARGADVLTANGITHAINLWDLAWPPGDADRQAALWRASPALISSCYVPDLDAVGTPGFAAELAAQVHRAADAGAVGLKVWKNLGLTIRDAAGARVAVSDPRLAPLWDAAAERGLPVMIHQGDPAAFFAPVDDDNPRIEELRAHPDWWFGAPTYPTLAQIHHELEAVVADRPLTTFIGVHFGSFMRWPDVDRMLSTYPNYHVDTSAAIADMGRVEFHELIRALIVRHQDRVLFGTDLVRCGAWDLPSHGADRWDLTEYYSAHWRFFETDLSDLAHPLPSQGGWRVVGLGLGPDVLDKLYRANAARLFRLPLT